MATDRVHQEVGRGASQDRPEGRRPSPAPVAAALASMHRLAGNRAVQRLLTSPRFRNDAALVDVEAGRRVLGRGDNGEAVRKVQHAVHDAGERFATFGVDGTYEAETARKVGRFQASHGVVGDASGQVGTATIRALDALFPDVALPATAGDPFTFAGTLAILCQWNSAMVRDLRNLRVEMVDQLQWADEQYDGSSWVAHPMNGAGETSGRNITISTNGQTNDDVAKTLYHEYQHARSPRAYSTRSWEDEERRAYEMETFWAIDRGLNPDPGLTTTDPVTGEVELDPAGVTATVGNYPGMGTVSPGEVIAKVGTNRVRVRLPNGRVIVRAAVAGDTVPGPRQISGARTPIPAAQWTC